MNVALEIDRRALGLFCLHHDIRRLSLFGSQRTDAAGPHSDIDFLIEFEPGHEPGLLGLAAMEVELSDLMGGRRVDPRTPQELSRYFRQEVLRTAEVQFAR